MLLAYAILDKHYPVSLGSHRNGRVIRGRVENRLGKKFLNECDLAMIYFATCIDFPGKVQVEATSLWVLFIVGLQ